jgi:RHS repeat-associated protein
MPFGQVRYLPGTPAITNTDFGYTGQRELDSEMGLMDYKARFYSPLLGRFVQPDTITPDGPQGLNRYSYANNNPIVYNDPNGHWPCYICVTTRDWAMQKTIQISDWWTGKDVGYTGSGGGYGHGPRQLIGNILGYSASNNASSFTELVIRGLLQYDHTDMTGDLLEEIKSDEQTDTKRKQAIQAAKHENGLYGVEDFSISGNSTVYLGGGLGSWDDPKAVPGKLAAYGNVATLAMRGSNFEYEINVAQDKTRYSVFTVTDVLDLRVTNEKRDWRYKASVRVFGLLYHDILGANDKMTTSATWSEFWSE